MGETCCFGVFDGGFFFLIAIEVLSKYVNFPACSPLVSAVCAAALHVVNVTVTPTTPTEKGKG